MSNQSLVMKQRWQNNREEMLSYQRKATENSPMTKKGSHRTEEHKQNISKALTGLPSPRKFKTYEEIYGPEKTKEVREKQRSSWTKERREQIAKITSLRHKQGDPTLGNGWNKGLTAKTDERVRKNTEGLTKTTREQRQGKTLEEIFGEEQGKNLRYQNYLNGLSQSPASHQKTSQSLLTKHTFEERQSWARKGGLASVHYGKKKDTSIELALQTGLTKHSIEFDTQVVIPDTCVIDIVPKNTKIAIFADGDYWHNLPNIIKKDDWINRQLPKQGWKILRFWEHEIHSDLNGCINKILEMLHQ